MNHILLAGASGRLGREIFAAGQNKTFSVHALTRTELANIGEVINRISNSRNEKIIIIDVTLPEGTEALIAGLEIAGVQGTIAGLVIGSTGHSSEQLKMISIVGKQTPVILSSNFSRGVYLFEEILNAKTSTGASVSELARTLGFDLSLWESHHTLKKDAPSGTARTLAAAAAIENERIASTRVGSVVGEHTLFMSQESEELRITHIAHARKLFAEGALDLCDRIFKTPLPAGTYNMSEALRVLLKN